ncbi:hypothetical protein GCM10010468_24320 [Actinocorallia longicatena]|uniref:DUF11 domain-containing protein n=1 Tax=Actinocorallia longicatena TaxID=111803 RepID=A0ABP6Q7F7_9ACTN
MVMVKSSKPALAAVSALVAAAGLATALAANAHVRAASNPVAGGNGFTVVVAGDAEVSGNENDGTMAIGGDLTLTGRYRVAGGGAGSFTAPGDTNPTALVIGGRVNWPASASGGSLQVLSQGFVKIGDLAASRVLSVDGNGALVNTQVNGGGAYDSAPRVELTTRQDTSSVGPGLPFDPAALFDAYRERADELTSCVSNVNLRDGDGAALAPTGIPAGTNARITLAAGRTNVLHLRASDLANISILTFGNRPTATAPLLVVVDTSDVGDSFTWAAPNFAGIGGSDASFILFDFPTATQITLPAGQGGTIEGTIFAPRARLTDLNSSNIEGNVIVGGLVHGSDAGDGGEIHSFPFATTLDCVPVIATETPTPTVTITQVTAPPGPTPATGQPSPPAPIPRPAPGRLVVDKRVDRTAVRVGRKVYYALRATNLGPGPLTRTSFVDDLSGVLRHGTVLGGFRSTDGRARFSRGRLTWAGSLAAHRSVVITFTVRTARVGTMDNSVVWSTGRDRTRTFITPRTTK